MTIQELIINKAAAWTFAMDWVKTGSQGSRHLRKYAADIKSRFYSDGIWNPDAEIVYLYFIEAAEMAEVG